jgi:lysophospholipase L1-like esterase
MMDPNTPFDFVHLACSGASIARCNPPCRGGPGGLLGPYPGINPPQPPPVPQDLPAQVDEAIRRADGRKPDAVLISIGVNDLEFGAVINLCVKAHSSDCSKKVYPPGSKENLTLDAWMFNQLKVLDGRYRVLAERLDKLGVARDHVFLNQYPNLLNDANGQLCKELHVAIFHNLNATEVKWLYYKFLVPLNTEVARAASANHWTLIPEQKAFNDRGYCVADGRRWIVTYDDSNNNQGNVNGTLHPNGDGQTAIANGLWPLLQRALDIPTRSQH